MLPGIHFLAPLSCAKQHSAGGGDQYLANVLPAEKIIPRLELYESLFWLPRTSGSDVGSAPVTGSSSNLESEETMCLSLIHI